MHRLIVALVLVAVGPVAESRAQDLPYGPTLAFAVYRNGEPIGRHELAFQHSGRDLTVSTTVDFTLKMLGFIAYRYTHRAQEIWNGDAFQSVATQTDDNGKKYAVRAQRTAEGIDVQRMSGHEVLPRGLLPTSHWNVRQISQSSLLNTQNGLQAHVQITPLGREPVKTATGSINASHYRYAGDVTTDQWFDDRGRWVKTTFKASDGSTIEYILQE
jgi:Family of unknown function (DUF6134)